MILYFMLDLRWMIEFLGKMLFCGDDGQLHVIYNKCDDDKYKLKLYLFYVTLNFIPGDGKSLKLHSDHHQGITVSTAAQTDLIPLGL